jgi:uncharacterized protein (TIGR02996 family)
MSIEQALLDDIVENLDDDTPRLVYADLLDERGEEKTAAFIRLQVERARLDDWEPRAFELDEEIVRLAVHRPTVLAAPAWARNVEYRRGFAASAVVSPLGSKVLPESEPRTTLEELTLSGAWEPFVEHFGDDIGDEAADIGWDWEAVARWPLLGQMRTLRLPVLVLNPRLDRARFFSGPEVVRAPAISRVDDLAALLASPQLGALRSLDLGIYPHILPSLRRLDTPTGWWQMASGGETAAQLLGSSPAFLRLKELRATGVALGWGGIGGLVDRTPPLTHLDLLDTALTEGDLGEMAGSGLFDGLHSLRLNSFRGNFGVMAVARRARFSALRELDLTAAGVRRDTLEALARLGHTQGLRSLVLDGNPLEARPGQPLLTDLLPSGLARLSLRDCDLGDVDAESLARWPGLAGVTVLDLSRNRFSKRGAWALAVSPHLETVRRVLIDTKSGPTAKELSRRFGTRWLR